MADPSQCQILDFGPFPVSVPRSVKEVGDLVHQAAIDGTAVYPLGGRTMLEYGNPPTRPGIGIDLRQLVEPIDYPARDMTITVQAGITIAKLAEILRTENQRLPVDVPRADQATLGGALATNASGPRRYGFGTFRDFIIGIAAINDAGQEFKGGGRVVKNVAGYDLCKLLVGSLGTLGVITQVTLKVKPIPEERAMLLLPCDSVRIASLLDLLHGSRTRPVCIDLLNAAALRYLAAKAEIPHRDAPWFLAIGFEDTRETVGWQIQQFIKELLPEDALGLDIRVGASSEPVWQWLVDFSALENCGFVFKANLLPRAVGEFCQAADRECPGILLQAHAGNGIVIARAPADLPLESAKELITRLQEHATQAQGNIVLLCCPLQWRPSFSVWGRPRSDLFLMRRVKTALDPRGLFNPGRFLTGT